jgi:hypothetical protein
VAQPPPQSDRRHNDVNPLSLDGSTRPAVAGLVLSGVALASGRTMGYK